MRIQTNYVHRFHLHVDPEAKVLDCFRVHVLDNNLLVCQGNRQNVTLNRLWMEMLDTVQFLQQTHRQRDYRQFGILRSPLDLQPFAVVIATEEARERVKSQLQLDMLCGGSNRSPDAPAEHERKVRHLIDAWDGLQWLEMN